jgi:hypothetical protein
LGDIDGIDRNAAAAQIVDFTGRRMTSPTKEPATPSSREFVKQSSLYQEFLAEREEILRHKWLESERLGYDIGFERALLDWIRKHREGWRAARRQSMAGPGSGSSSPFQGSGRQQ